MPGGRRCNAIKFSKFKFVYLISIKNSFLFTFSMANLTLLNIFRLNEYSKKSLYC